MPNTFLKKNAINKIHFKFCIISILLFFSISAYASTNRAELPFVENQVQISYSAVTLPGNETMGLVGGNYLFKLPYSLYSGLGIYGAVDGDRGGFFTGGMHIGWQKNLNSNYFFELNGFVGGGGGGSAPQGGGLMLRKAFLVGKKNHQHKYAIGIDEISFPNGQINSTQLTLSYRYLFRSLQFPGWNTGQDEKTWQYWRHLLQQNESIPQYFSVQLMRYFPTNNSKNRSNKPPNNKLDILGIRWSTQLNSRVWSEFETAGAMAGGIDGYALVMGGVSYNLPISNQFIWTNGWLIGAAGGGDVNTGGGVVTRVYTGVDISLTRSLSLLVQTGVFSAVEQEFSALTANINLAYRYHGFSMRKVKNTGNLIAVNPLNWKKLRYRFGFQRYTNYQRHARKQSSQNNPDVDLVHLKMDAFFSRAIFISGQAIGAFDGKAGGYAVGLIGPGLSINKHINFELMVGVAGGGGIDVGSGKIFQPMINGNYPLSKEWSIEVSGGHIKAIDGKLSAYVVALSAEYHFTIAVN